MITLERKIVLGAKGASAPVAQSFKSINVAAEWDGAVDYDLMVTLDGPNGFEFVYFKVTEGANGQVKLSGDAGVGDKVAEGGNKEEATITSFNGIKRLGIYVGDYKRMETGKEGRFDQNNIRVTLTDDLGNQQILKASSGTVEGNLCCVGILDLSGEQPMIHNVSEARKFKSLGDADAILTELHNLRVNA